ncbi:MAG: hypothetical protein OK452_07650 [Thaumarchaeota archaeon]|nr:hypothetical protein [Nitrososphaerota archaeon]
MSWLVLGRDRDDKSVSVHGFDWASEVAKAQVEISQNGLLPAGQVNKLRYLGHCYVQSAFQTSSDAEFKRTMLTASAVFDRGSSLAQSAGTGGDEVVKNRLTGLSYYCRAQAAESEQEILDYLKTAHQALSAAVASAGSSPLKVHASLLPELIVVSTDIMYYEANTEVRLSVLDVPLKLLEDPITLPASVADEIDLVTICEAMLMSTFASTQLPEFRQRYEAMERAANLKKRLMGAVGEIVDPRALASAFCALAYPLSFDEEPPFCDFETLLPRVEATKDTLAIGSLFAAHLRNELAMLGTMTDPQKAKAFLDSKEDEARRALLCLDEFRGVRRFHSSPGYVYWTHADLLFVFQRQFSPLIEERVRILDRLLEMSRRIRRNSPPSGIANENSNLSLYTYQRALLEQETESRRRILNEAWQKGQEYERATRTFYPRYEIIDAIHQRPYGLIKRELASLDIDGRAEQLQESVGMLAKAATNIQSSLRNLPISNPLSWQHYLGGILYELGSVQLELAKGSQNQALVRESLSSFERGLANLESDKETTDYGILAKTGQCLWRKAECLDSLGDFAMASDSFKAASSYFGLLADKLSGLKDSYAELRHYMDAWAETEAAKKSHEDGDYSSAKEHYLMAAAALESASRWSEFRSSLQLWSAIEDAESKSREWRTKDACDAFGDAALSLAKIESEIASRNKPSASAEDREHLSNLRRAIVLRKEYCTARKTLEEARQADYAGQSTKAAEKYAESSAGFERLIDRLETEREKKDVQAILHLTKAWSFAAEAESKSRPELYTSAVELFTKVRDETESDTLAVLAAGNALFCQALQYAVRFALTRDQETFTKAKSYVDQAARLYDKRNFEREATWAKASGRMLDAYSYITLAETEADPEKKARFYMMSEKVIQLAADLYEKAGLTGKRNETLKMMENIKEEKQLSISLTGILRDPTLTVSTSSFRGPASSFEMPTGAETLDVASLHASLFLSKEHVNLREQFEMEVEVVNTGTTPAMLIKVEDLFPDVLEVSSKPDQYRLVKNTLDLKGTRLAPMKSEEFKVSFRPKEKGLFSVKPRIVFVDSQGKLRTSETEPVTISVTEMGIGGWLRGS